MIGFKLSDSIKKGQSIRTANGWLKVLEVTDTGVKTKDGTVAFGDTILGWKAR